MRECKYDKNDGKCYAFNPPEKFTKNFKCERKACLRWEVNYSKCVSCEEELTGTILRTEGMEIQICDCCYAENPRLNKSQRY